MQLSTIEAIIFDFDGVLADTSDVAMAIIERIASYKKVAAPSADFIRTNDPKSVMKVLGVKWWELPYFVHCSRKWAVEINPEARLFPWADSLLKTAHSLCDNVWIVSSNSPERIIKTFAIGGINFDTKYVIANVGFLSKSRHLKKIISKQKLDSNYVVYVGDEARDIIAAHNAGIKCLSVGWGFQSAEFLNSLNPGCVLKEPASFEDAIKAITTSHQ